MCNRTRSDTIDQADDFADLRRPSEIRPLRLLMTVLILSIVMASTTFHLKGLEAAASIILN